VYMPGHAGNFLSRLFGLSTETIPQMPKTTVEHLLRQKLAIPPDLDRVALYRFDQAAQFSSWQQYHRAWSDFYQADQLQELNRVSGEIYNTVIHAIHPHEFVKNLYQINTRIDLAGAKFAKQDPQPWSHGIYHVQLRMHDDWVAQQQEQLGFQWRDREAQQFDHIAQHCSDRCIDLDRMLINQSEFLAEYRDLCESMSITANPDQALMLYANWRSIRYPI